MEFKKIIKKDIGKYIIRYDVLYETVDHKEKVYEMISRNKNIESEEDLKRIHADAVVMIMHNEEGDKILLNKEYRMACANDVFNFPAGLIESGESFQDGAKRELKEETGLDLVSIKDVLKESYSAVGFSNEMNICVIGVAKGTITESNSSVEEIQAAWYTKEEVRKLLKESSFAGRTQSYCYLWSKE